MKSIDNKLLTEVVLLLREASSKFNSPLPAGANADDVDHLASTTGIVVPSEFRKWLLTCNAPRVGYGFYFGINTVDEVLDIRHLIQSYPSWVSRGWLPLAGDGCGNYYLVATRGEFGPGAPVFYVDTAEGEDTPAYLVASNTLYCISFLLKRDLDRTEWPFNGIEVIGSDPEIVRFDGLPLPWDA
jgi:hypothetical protein